LADYAARQDHKTILGHLRESPSLAEAIEKIYAQFVKPTDSDATELVPQSGMDEEFDTIEKEISEIESELESELRKIVKKLK
jgi:DNA mismatch repair protein MSH6